MYTAFFIVQIFFNFGLSLNANGHSNQSILQIKSLSAKNITILTHKSSNSCCKKSYLNKRFYPESLPAIGLAIHDPFITIALKVNASKPQAYLLIASILTDCLRGPPTVVA